MNIDLCNHYKSRSVSYLNFRSNKYKVNDNHKPHNKYSEFVPIKFVSKELEDIDLRGPGGGGLHQNSLEIDFIVVSGRRE